MPCQAADETDNQQFTKVMTGVAGPRIGDIFEGGEKGFHVGIKLLKGCSAFKNPSVR
jgi:hypothetical protein